MKIEQEFSGLQVLETGLQVAEAEKDTGTKYAPDDAASINEEVDGNADFLGEEAKVGEGRILVMDSEEIIRELVKDFLTSLGYDVETAGDGGEAIDLYKRAKEKGKQFDAVIMDLKVTVGMGGKEAIKKLMEIDPSVKAIVSSGYSNHLVLRDYEKYGFREVLPKPYKIVDLGLVIKKVMSTSDE